MPLVSLANKYIHADSYSGASKEFSSGSDITFAARVAAIGATVVTLEMYGQETITADLDIPDNITLIMKRGSKLTLAGAEIMLYIGNCICEGVDHFVIGTTCYLLLGRAFHSPAVRQFTGAGLSNVRFGCGPELITNNRFTSETGWTLGAGWTIDDATNTLTAGVATSTNATFAIAGVAANQWYVTMAKITVTAGTLLERIGSESETITTSGTYFNVHEAVNTTTFTLDPSTTFQGSLTMVSCRRIYGCGLDEVLAEWWGAVGDGTTDNATFIQSAMYATGTDSRYPMPHTLRFGQGNFRIGSTLNLIPYTCLVGSPMGTTIAALSTMSDTVMIAVTPTYGDYNSTYRTRLKVLNQLKLDSNDLALDDLVQFKVTEDFNMVSIENCVFAGNDSYRQMACHFDASDSSVNINSLIFRNNNVYGFTTLKITDGVVDSLAALYLQHGSNMQNALVEDNTFYATGTHIIMGGSNNTIANNNFEASNVPGRGVINRGSFLLDSGLTVTTETPSCIITSTDGGTSHPFDSVHSTYRFAVVNFTGDASWIAKSGLYPFTIGGSTGAWTTTLTGLDVSACVGDAATITLEAVGGHVWPVRLHNRPHVLRENYFDGVGVVNVLTQYNTLAGATTYGVGTFRDNRGLLQTEVAEFLRDTNVYDSLFYDITYISSTTFSIVENIDINNDAYIWVYQYTATKVYGWIRTQVVSATRHVDHTDYVIVDPIMVSDATAYMTAETYAFTAGTNWHLEYDGKIYCTRT